MVTHFLDDGYELVAAREDVREALDQLNSKKKQVIYFDDFLGRSSFGERLSKNEDEGILRLLKSAARGSNKRVILTTREYILTEAQQRYERLNTPDLELAKCIVELAKYTRGNRARILYNHLYFSDIPPDCIWSLLAEHRYRSVIDHPNFSPRIIEWMTSEMGRASVTSAKFAEEFLANLDNPSRIWQHAFETHLTAAARCLLHVLATLPQRVDFDDLEIAWNACLPASEQTSAPGETRLKYERTLKQLDGSFISTERIDSKTAVSFHNPSVRDFVAARIGGNPPMAGQLLEAAQFFTQIEGLMRLKPDGKQSTTATGLIGDSDRLRKAIRRTITQQNPSLQLIKYRNSGASLRREPLDYGNRFSAIADWSHAIGSRSLLDDCCRLFEELFERIKLPVSVTMAGLMSAIIRSGADSPQNDALLQQLATRITETLEDIEDWRRWGHFVSQHGNVVDVGDRSDLLARAAAFCEEEAEAIVDNADSADDIDAWANELEEVGKAWQINISSTIQHLYETANERSSEEGSAPDGDYYERRSFRSDESDSDEIIGRLFETLRSSRH